VRIPGSRSSCGCANILILALLGLPGVNYVEYLEHQYFVVNVGEEMMSVVCNIALYCDLYFVL